MKVTPLDIRRKEFKRSVRGYMDEDVDLFLDTVADEMERVLKESEELRGKIRSLEEEVAGHAHIREALEKTLVAAQLQSEEIRSNAQKQSQSMLREAEAKAKSTVDDFYDRTQSVQQTLMRLKLLEEDFRFKFKGLLDGYMKLLDDEPFLATVSEEGVVEGAKGPAGDVGEVSEDSEGEQSASTPQPPNLPKTDAANKPAADEERAGPVYFGRKGDEPDDPFPEIGGDQQKPRDFAW